MSPLVFEPPPPADAADIKNILLYGPPGQGKSTGAASAPGPILYLNAEGPARLRFARRVHGNDKIHEVKITCKNDLDQAYLHLKNGGEEKTVVIDTFGETYQILLEEVAGGDTRITLPQHGDVQTILRRFVQALKELPQTVVIVCHEDLVTGNEGEMIHRPATGGQKLPGVISAMVDVVAYCKALTDDQGETKYVGQLIAGNGRQAKWSGPSLGSVRPLDLTEWLAASAAAGNETAPKARKAA